MLWKHCHGPAHIRPLAGRLHRVVESRAQVATMAYVDTLQEQVVLEELIEQSNPPGTEDSSGYHRLLSTPFRDQILKWGSRFGQRGEPGIFYGSCSAHAAFAETAFYRFVFWRSIDATPPSPFMDSQHTLYSARYATNEGVYLQQPPFDGHIDRISHPADYTISHALGAAMRAIGVEAFLYRSARDPARDDCIGIFRIDVLKDTQPVDPQPWSCRITAGSATFKQHGERHIHHFKVGDFLCDNEFPVLS